MQASIIKLKNHKNRQITGLIILYMFLMSVNLSAQMEEWKTKKFDDGKIIVKSCVSKQVDKDGNTVPLIEYIATTVANVSMKNCIALIKDVPKHKEFLSRTKKSETIKTISENEWIVYYYYSSWPFPSSDCVAKMVFTENNEEKMAVFTLTAEPSMYDDVGARRLSFYNVLYSFRDIGDGKTEVTTTMKTSPAYKVPLWMIRKSVSGSAADVVRNIIKFANESQMR